jgi:hypothetical protein
VTSGDVRFCAAVDGRADTKARPAREIVTDGVEAIRAVVKR